MYVLLVKVMLYLRVLCTPFFCKFLVLKINKTTLNKLNEEKHEQPKNQESEAF